MTDYELTRRDALKALGAAGVTVTGGAAALAWNESEDDDTVESAEDDADASESEFGEHERETYRAVAAMSIRARWQAYRSSSTATSPDGSRQTPSGRRKWRPLLRSDAYTREREDTVFTALDTETQEETLRGMGVNASDPDPHGDPRHRVRYYLVNDLLFALYSSPTGGELVGIENPQGYPGGTSSYQQPPNDR